MSGTDLIPDVIDRIVKLLRYQKERNKQLFSEHIQPLYGGMLECHSQYLRAFAELSLAVTKGMTYRDVIATVLKHKAELEAFRSELFHTSVALLNSGVLPPPAQSFVKACISYFDVQYEIADMVQGDAKSYKNLRRKMVQLARKEDRSYRGHFSALVEHMEREEWTAMEAMTADRTAIVYIMGTRDTIRENWERVAGVYSSCKIEMTK